MEDLEFPDVCCLRKVVEDSQIPRLPQSWLKGVADSHNVVCISRKSNEGEAHAARGIIIRKYREGKYT